MTASVAVKCVQKVCKCLRKAIGSVTMHNHPITILDVSLYMCILSLLCKVLLREELAVFL